MAIFFLSQHIQLGYLYINSAKYTVSNKYSVNMKYFCIRMLYVSWGSLLKVINIENAWCDLQTLLK